MTFSTSITLPQSNLNVADLHLLNSVIGKMRKMQLKTWMDANCLVAESPSNGLGEERKEWRAMFASVVEKKDIGQDTALTAAVVAVAEEEDARDLARDHDLAHAPDLTHAQEEDLTADPEAAPEALLNHDLVHAHDLPPEAEAEAEAQITKEKEALVQVPSVH
eukprot:TRINITY_DN1782_c0_g2_i1.p2 TRINITY_DN1782_c0_g2~~TRINITY_DN1782_c0_g2_i1.p2  ORF type:complete len:163 (+),score=44.83 TRINITY_DN1782_c0_g2_i1:159-647(+)